MDSKQLQSLSAEVQGIAKEAAHFIRSQFGKVGTSEAESKSANSFVTYVDKTAEEMIVKKLKTLIPEAGFITEEDTVENSEN